MLRLVFVHAIEEHNYVIEVARIVIVRNPCEVVRQTVIGKRARDTDPSWFTPEG